MYIAYIIIYILIYEIQNINRIKDINDQILIYKKTDMCSF